ncbi:sensor histidine kinase [Myceligenerans xiligouense]|uniref:histidine kinase n=1 Tax=Myceligenerans xiligouense TaxID=253184 RepID=A0A3N4YP02_9MICO|nr:histidine kinase [Myceligenerans xiligouense]RPF21094.1 signal transduction histidine kinase [Myceligenerans xiligouense]
MSALGRVRHRWYGSPVVVRDLLPGVVLLVASLVPVLRVYGTQLGDLPARPLDGLAAVALVLECLPLALRRRWPLLSLALVSAGFVLDQLRSYHLVAGAAMALSLMSSGLHLDHRRRATAAALTGAYTALATALAVMGSPEGPAGFVTFYLLMVLAWGAGAWLRSARVAEADRRRRAAVTARAEERTRLARELHDVVTHHVTAMVVQAQAARYLAAEPDRVDQALATVADTGRLAVTDLRQLLDVLDAGPSTRVGSPAAPDPVGAPPGVARRSVEDVTDLVRQARRAGQPVELTQETCALPAAAGAEAGLTAYRVVQEALTNALKHAPGSRTDVSVHQTEGEITVQVTTGAPERRSRAAPGSGRGLAGLRERVEALSGTFAVGRRPDGGFDVRAHIPVTDLATSR